jgi:glycosyltransferase involved in cell wall biosynthesis
LVVVRAAGSPTATRGARQHAAQRRVRAGELTAVTRSFAIVANGTAEGPAQALRDHLVAVGADVVTILHPLTPEQGKAHVLTRHSDGQLVSSRSISLPLRPPLSFVVDPVVPPRTPRVDAWFGFNPLACGRGLLARRLGRARHTFLWSVDFVPDRFGEGTMLTRLYDRLDRYSCRHVDGRIELSAAAREGRNARHGLKGGAAEAHIVPMGAWLDRVPATAPDGIGARRVVFLGHLVARMGVETLLDALAELRAQAEPIAADVIGTGPLEQELRSRAATLGLGDAVTFHGFIPDHRDVERILAACTVAVAPYAEEAGTFTRFADPGKLKAYVAAGLPTLLTDVPPNARELAREGGAEIVADDAGALARAILRLLAAPEEWLRRREAALTYARRFDWAVALPDVLRRLGLDVEPAASPRTKPPT